MSTRLQIAALVFMMTAAVVFRVGVVLVRMIPTLSENAFCTIPAVVAASLLVSAPVAWFIAPSLRARHQSLHPQ
jgi:hypothetical protein